MNDCVASLDDRPSVQSDSEILSPELALVDEHLAERARCRLPDPDDVLARLETHVRMSRASSLQKVSEPALDLVGKGRLASLPAIMVRRSRVFNRGHIRLYAAVGTAALAVTALLVGVRVDLRGSPAGADTNETGRPPLLPAATTVAAPLPHAPASSRTPAHATPRRFVWAPSGNASGYHIQLFRGSSLVFATNTKRAQMIVPTTWRFNGQLQRLDPGEYRWYVWPLVSDRRASQATVQARLVVSPH